MSSDRIKKNDMVWVNEFIQDDKLSRHAWYGQVINRIGHTCKIRNCSKKMLTFNNIYNRHVSALEKKRDQ